MQRNLPLILGFLMAPISALGLFWQQSFVWILCPQALAAMFLRQAQGSYGSLGAADWLELAVAGFYYPVIGLILLRALKSGAFPRTTARVAIWHAAALAAAVIAWQLRNRLWHVG